MDLLLRESSSPMDCGIEGGWWLPSIRSVGLDDEYTDEGPLDPRRLSKDLLTNRPLSIERRPSGERFPEGDQQPPRQPMLLVEL